VLRLQSTIAKLMPTPEAHMAVLCVLGPLAIIPFSIVRVGTGHLYLWAMGMISALYVGMPIIAGWSQGSGAYSLRMSFKAQQLLQHAAITWCSMLHQVPA
jgi:hypothetical protein